MATKAGRPVAGYIRVSRIGGRSGEGYISPDEQRQQIEGYAKELGLSIAPDAWADDQDYSGGNFDRPGWEGIVKRIESGELAGVIVLRVDRFARNVPDGAAQIRHIVDECHGIFGSAQERMDPATPSGRYMLQQFLNNAELQLNMLKGSWQTAKERAIKRGAHIGPTPLGFGRVPKGELRSGCLLPLPEWKPIIRAIFRRAASVKSGNKMLANFMNERYPRPDGRRWTATTVGHVIANRVYLGEVAYRPRKENFVPLVNPDAHESMIDEATWLEAQRTPGTKRTNAGEVNLLSGLIRCAGCRYRMSASRGGANVRVYRCIGDHGAGKCPEPPVIECERVERFVLGEVQDQWEARFAVTLQGAERPADADDIATRLAEARGELEAFASDLTARRLLGDGYHAALEARARAVSAIEAQWAALDRDRGHAAASEISWDSLDRGELRAVLAGALDAVYVRRGRNVAVGDRACLVWTGELDDDVPSRGKAVTVFRSFEWPEKDRPSVGVAAA
jgi:DNA invertase Pin-like site-specific DNA recombinase